MVHVVKGLAVLLFLALAVVTYRRSLVWQSENALWTDAVSSSPEMPRPHLNLGLEYEKAGDLQRALAEFDTAERLSYASYRNGKHQRMSRVAARSNIALIWLVQGRYRESEELLNAALTDWPGYPQALVNRGTAKLAQGRCQEAAIDYLMAGVLELPRCRIAD